MAKGLNITAVTLATVIACGSPAVKGLAKLVFDGPKSDTKKTELNLSAKEIPQPKNFWDYFISSAYAGGEFPVDMFFVDISPTKKHSGVYCGLTKESFLDAYQKNPELKTLIPPDVVRDLYDGRNDNYEGTLIAMTKDGRFLTGLRGNSLSKAHYGYSKPVSPEQKALFGRIVDNYIKNK